MYWYVVHRCILVKVSNEKMKIEKKIHKCYILEETRSNTLNHVKENVTLRMR